MRRQLAFFTSIFALTLALSQGAARADEKMYRLRLDEVKHGSIELDPAIPESGKYAEGTVVKVTAKPEKGYVLDSIYYSVPGMWGAMYTEGFNPTYEVTVDRNKNVGASFIKEDEVSGLKVTQDIVYAQPGKKPLKYDVYAPTGADGLPIVVIIHGGGWSSNNEDIMRGLARELTKEGRFVVCSIDYRWLGKLDGDETPNTMANLIEDVFGAIAHIMEHASEYGGDPTRIGVTGDSAGGHLSATASLMTNKIGDGGYGVTEGVYEFMPTYLPEGKSVDEVRDEMMKAIKAAAPSYGVFSAEALGGFLKQPPETAIPVAPKSNIPLASERSVPQYLLRGTEDFLIQDPEVAGFVEALKVKGQTAIYVQVKGANHAFFDWKPNDQVKANFERFGVPYAAEMKAFFESELY